MSAIDWDARDAETLPLANDLLEDLLQKRWRQTATEARQRLGNAELMNKIRAGGTAAGTKPHASSRRRRAL
jgi:hypothetical protein